MFLSIDEYENIWKKISELIKKNTKSTDILEYKNRVISTGKVTAYLKISEGCSNRCTYCAIPSIRGPHISRKMEEILEEAKILAASGVRELIVIAQDTTKYGVDIYKEQKLPELLNELSKIKGIKWVRFLYAYPESISDKLIETVKNNKKICKYFDIPVQHFSNKVLKNMNRNGSGKSIENLLEKIRKEIPEVIIRSTLIVGFPKETEEDFFELYEFIHRAKFDRLGAFTYSKEEGTKAYSMEGQVHSKTKQSRLNKIMRLQQKISTINLEDKIGNTYEVLVDGITDDKKYLITRSYMHIPDEDGVVFVKRTNSNIKIR